MEGKEANLVRRGKGRKLAGPAMLATDLVPKTGSPPSKQKGQTGQAKGKNLLESSSSTLLSKLEAGGEDVTPPLKSNPSMEPSESSRLGFTNAVSTSSRKFSCGQQDSSIFRLSQVKERPDSASFPHSDLHLDELSRSVESENDDDEPDVDDGSLRDHVYTALHEFLSRPSLKHREGRLRFTWAAHPSAWVTTQQDRLTVYSFLGLSLFLFAFIVYYCLAFRTLESVYLEHRAMALPVETSQILDACPLPCSPPHTDPHRSLRLELRGLPFPSLPCNQFTCLHPFEVRESGDDLPAIFMGDDAIEAQTKQANDTEFCETAISDWLEVNTRRPPAGILPRGQDPRPGEYRFGTIASCHGSQSPFNFRLHLTLFNCHNKPAKHKLSYSLCGDRLEADFNLSHYYRSHLFVHVGKATFHQSSAHTDDSHPTLPPDMDPDPFYYNN